MPTGLLLDVPPHIRALTAVEGTDLSSLVGAKWSVISSVRFNHLDPQTTAGLLAKYEALRYLASLASTRAYVQASVPQIVMVDPASDDRVPAAFAANGAIVVMTPRPGLATPYLDAAQLVRLYAGPAACVLKAEADKLLNQASLERIAEMLEDGYDILVGDRTAESMASMTPMQHRTESLIDTLVPAVLQVPHGVSFGVQAYSPHGLAEFLRYEQYLDTLDNSWTYLISTPTLGVRHGLAVGSVPITAIYDEAMVTAEDNPVITLKRFEQLLLMLEGAIRVGELTGFSDPQHVAPDPERRQLSDAAIAQIRNLLAAAEV